MTIPGADAVMTLGWREWVRLPSLRIPAVRAKMDTGAQSSALHVVSLHTERRDGVEWVTFASDVNPRRPDRVIPAEAQVHDERLVRTSSGHEELRVVIRTRLEIGGRAWEIVLTLAQREMMRFRLLIGREALRGRAVVDVARSYLAAPPPGRRTLAPPTGRKEEE